MEGKKLTQKEFDEYKARLNYLTSIGRDEMAEKLQEARSHGDLSENAEYDEARNDQAKMEAEIHDLEQLLKDAEIADEKDFKKGVVHLGSWVSLKDIEFEDTYCYQVLGKGDIENDIISDLSPIGSRVMGKRKGDIIEVPTPNEKMIKMEITAVNAEKPKIKDR